MKKQCNLSSSVGHMLRRATLPVLIFVLGAALAACGKKKADGEDGGLSFSESGSTGVSGSTDQAEQAAKDLAADYGVDLPDGIVSAADPNEIYDAGNMIQMDGSELYINVKDSADWVDSGSGLSDGMKYISVSAAFSDYGSGMVKELPDPGHFYLIELKDENGGTLDPGAGGTGGRIRPVTDMSASEIRSDAAGYYNAARPFDPEELDGMNVWLLYEVPEETREVTVACWLTDDFSQPFNAAFRVGVGKKDENHTFGEMKGEEIAKLLDTSERPSLEDFGWYASPSVFADRTTGDYRDPEYDEREYAGGWKCYIFRDVREYGLGFEAHLANLYVENYQPEEEYEKGWVDVRIDWYLGIDGDGNVTDESGLPDTLCGHEWFYYNRMENEDSNYPFASFSFEYAQDAALGRGRYVNEDREEYMMALVRADGENVWILDGVRPAMTVMPGTEDVPVPADLSPSGKASEKGSASDAEESSAAGAKGSGAALAATAAGDATLDDFGWYFDDAFPQDGAPLTQLQDLGGEWKCILNVVTAVSGGDQCRIMVGRGEIEYMGYKVTALLHPKEMHSFMVSDPDNMETEIIDKPANIVMNGDWIEDAGAFDVASESSGLRLVMYDFAEKDGIQYAYGSVFNQDTEIGEAAFFRAR
ncbi:MAG: hypothetical protein J5969_07820 [Lachnospiraceae bacterium]|nr:hypothetical protein [Lachnospiraceae bacterium]